MAIIKLDNKDILISISNEEYLTNKQHIDEALSIPKKVLKSGTIAIKNYPEIKWASLRNKDELLKEFDSIINEINLRCDDEKDRRISNSIAIINSRIQIVKNEIKEKL